jgi:hypothetical protein
MKEYDKNPEDIFLLFKMVSITTHHIMNEGLRITLKLLKT